MRYYVAQWARKVWINSSLSFSVMMPSRARLASTLVTSARVMSAILTDVRGSRSHYGSDPIGANLIDVALDQTAGIAMVERH